MSQRVEPAYRLLADELTREILSGTYAQEEALPTEAELVESHGLSRQTVRRAFQELVSSGLVYRVAGRGTFVSPAGRPFQQQFGSMEELMGTTLNPELELIEPLTTRIDVAAAGRLHCSDDSVGTLRFRRVHEGRPYSVTDAYFPPDITTRLSSVPELASVGAISRGTISRITLIGVLDDLLDSPIAEADQSITAIAATDDVAATLDCEPGDPLLRIDRLYRDRDGNPVQLAISAFLPDMYSYRVRLRRSAS